jgi:MerR family transcriptional regulator, light-induced transcriptional regulator
VIDEKLYRAYFNALLAGRRAECRDSVQTLLDGKIAVKMLYSDLFQRSLYEIGDLWENNRITVANEHLATAITESLLNLVYPSVFATDRIGKKAVISCSANEFHQVGGKMVADLFELNGWDGHFLGANTPPEDLAQFIQDVQPDIVGLSLSILSNMDHLKRAIEILKSNFPDMNLIVGGQAFRWGGADIIKPFKNTHLVTSIDDLERLILDV